MSRPDHCSLRWIHFTKGLKRRVRIAVCDRIRRIAEDDAVIGVEGIVGRAHLYRAPPIGPFKKDEGCYESGNQIVIVAMPSKPTGGIAADGNDLQLFCTHNIHEFHHKLSGRTLTA